MLAARQNERFSQAEIEDIRARERQAQLKVLKEEKNKAAALLRSRIIMLASVLVIFSLAFCYTFIEAKILGCAKDINTMKNEIASVERNNERMAVDALSLASLERVETYAKLNLGMVFPDQNKIAYMDFGGVGAAMASLLEDEVLSLLAGASGKPAEDVKPILQALDRLLNGTD